MPTIITIFELQDRYSETIDRISGATASAQKNISAAAGETDKALGKTKSFVESAASGASKLAGSVKGVIGGFFELESIQKGIDIADNFSNMSVKLSTINDGLQTNAQLQDKVYKAAERSRGSYMGMASSVAKMGQLAGDSFKNNDELIAFTELAQKSFRAGGADSEGQQAGMDQLTQAMGSGGLQGDGFSSLLETAPLIAEAISKFTSKSVDDLKTLSAEGGITADVLKSSILAGSGDINSSFADMPKTFGDIFSEVQNRALKAFEPVIERVNSIINSSTFTNIIGMVMTAIDFIANGLNNILSFVQANWGVIAPILLSIIGALALIAFLYLPVMLVQWLLINWPILLIAAAITLLIYMMTKFSDVTAKVFGFIGGLIGVLVSSIYNSVVGFINFFIGQINLVLDLINLVIEALNLIPGVNIGLIKEVKSIEYMDTKDAWSKGQNIGKAIGGSLGGVGDKLSSLTGSGLDSFMQKGANSGPDLDLYMKNGALPVTSKDGSMKVDVSDEDLKYLQDIAERDYINKFSTATLAPNIQISIAGSGDSDADEKLAERVGRILQEQIAVAAEGAY